MSNVGTELCVIYTNVLTGLDVISTIVHAGLCVIYTNVHIGLRVVIEKTVMPGENPPSLASYLQTFPCRKEKPSNHIVTYYHLAFIRTVKELECTHCEYSHDLQIWKICMNCSP